MTTDNKTLADVQPGGRVRLGDQRSDLVPGIVRCAKCSFQLHRTNLYLQSGTVGAGDSKTEPCPNGCGPLWPVTWETWAREGWAEAERLHLENAALAARQPVGQIVGWQHCADNYAHMVISDSNKTALKEGETEEGIRKIDAAYSIPLVRQPATPPAQAVDLGAVREALRAAEGLATICASVDGYSREEVAASGRAMRQQFADALAKVDSQAVGNG